MSTINVKISDLIQQYDGSGDFAEWIRKLELVAQLQNLDHLENYLPLFLSAGAFAVYEALDDAVKKDYSKLKSALMSAFSMNCFVAYEQLMSRRLDSAEAVDVFLADIRRLASLVCPNPPEALIKCAFVCGLPAAVKSQLQAVAALDSLPLADVTGRARSLMASVSGGVAAAARSILRQSAVKQTSGRRRCFVCGSDSHLVRSCPRRYNAGSERDGQLDAAPSASRTGSETNSNQKNL